MGRGAYATPARVWAGSDDTVTIRWYQVPDDTPVLPFDSFMASHVYEEDYGVQRTGPGEVGRIARNRVANIPHPPGDHYCGQPAWFADGLPASQRNAYPCRCVPFLVDGSATLGFNANASVQTPAANATLGFDALAELPAGLVLADATIGFNALAELPAGLVLADATIGFNADLDDPAPPGVQVVVNGWGISDGTFNDPVEWDSENYDDADYWTPGDPTFITPPAVQLYTLDVQLVFTLSIAEEGIGQFVVNDEEGSPLWLVDFSVFNGVNTHSDSTVIELPGPIWCGMNAVFSASGTGNATFTVTPS